ncbi:bifunctional adenosylcobinamide kinase/adenosylcobinamide-phosphate guanylyltransferase [Bhargavaea cecembensis]|uniref:bifunctional adenosylcobinamide kinase/adenosylcobinamide-phosphate guanylyltransferase n=1 Tax=Bhargavaea cecembensis TaxID=394098 RepID=UPI00058F514D|nr:bifunctional adenosylcobinamide kinase/adenosylcobinamide-phosphate guanylyltransferase [Bhargavaea cecembensis]
MARGEIIFISGGVRSGKTAFAEEWIAGTGARRLVYAATGRPTDPEMEDRIRRHRADRSARPEQWETIERPTDLPGILPMIRKGDAVLIDCITTWLANEMYDGYEDGTPCHEQAGCLEEKEEALLSAVNELAEKASAVVIVSNEVLDEPPSEWTETRKYATVLGRIHRRLVALSDRAFEMDAGLAHQRKGGGRR